MTSPHGFTESELKRTEAEVRAFTLTPDRIGDWVRQLHLTGALARHGNRG